MMMAAAASPFSAKSHMSGIAEAASAAQEAAAAVGLTPAGDLLKARLPASASWAPTAVLRVPAKEGDALWSLSLAVPKEKLALAGAQALASVTRMVPSARLELQLCSGASQAMATAAGFESRNTALRTLSLVFSAPTADYQAGVVQRETALRVVLIANMGNTRAFGATWSALSEPLRNKDAVALQKAALQSGARLLKLNEEGTGYSPTSLALEANAHKTAKALVLVHDRHVSAPLVLPCTCAWETIELWNLIETHLVGSGHYMPTATLCVLAKDTHELRPLASCKADDLPLVAEAGTQVQTLHVFVQPWLRPLRAADGALPSYGDTVAVTCKSTPGAPHFEAMATALCSDGAAAQAAAASLRVVGLLADGKGVVVRRQKDAPPVHRQALVALATASASKASDGQQRAKAKDTCEVLAQLSEQPLRFYFLSTTRVREVLKLLSTHLELDEETDECQSFWDEDTEQQVQVDVDSNPTLAEVFASGRARLVYNSGRLWGSGASV